MDLRASLACLGCQILANIRGALRNPWRFILMAGAIAINDVAFFALWILYFAQFDSLRGWNQQDVANLSGFACTAWGLAFSVGYSTRQLLQHFQSGTLDTYLVRPQPLLPSLMVACFSMTNVGNLISGCVYWFVFGGKSWSDVPLLVFLTLIIAALLLGIAVCIQMLALWLKGTPRIAEQFSFIVFFTATAPQQGFGSWGKIIVHTIVPGAFVGMVPVAIARGDAPEMLPVLILAALAYATLAHVSFQAMVRRYMGAR